MRSNLAAVLTTMVGVFAMAQSSAMAQSPAMVQSAPPATAPSPGTMPAPAAPPEPETGVIGRNGLLLGIELGLSRGMGVADDLGMTELGGHVGWASHGQAAFFATVSAGVIGADEGAVFAALGVGARIYAGRAFIDLRLDRMRAAAVECEEDCSSVGVTRFSGAIGLDAVRGTHGGMQLSLRAARIEDISVVTFGLGGYVELY
jgi:hypothetical protein